MVTGTEAAYGWRTGPHQGWQGLLRPRQEGCVETEGMLKSGADVGLRRGRAGPELPSLWGRGQGMGLKSSDLPVPGLQYLSHDSGITRKQEAIMPALHNPSHHSWLQTRLAGLMLLLHSPSTSVAPDSSHPRKVVFPETSITLVPEPLPCESLLPAGQMELYTQGDPKGAMGLGHRGPGPSEVPNSRTYSHSKFNSAEGPQSHDSLPADPFRGRATKPVLKETAPI